LEKLTEMKTFLEKLQYLSPFVDTFFCIWANQEAGHGHVKSLNVMLLLSSHWAKTSFGKRN